MKIVLAANLDERHAERLRAEFQDVNFEFVGDRDAVKAAARDADALIGGWGHSADTFQEADRLRWYHHFGVGVDGLPLDELAGPDLVITNNRSVRSSNIAEHILAMMLGFARGLPEIIRYQVRHEWHHADRGVFEIGGQKLGVIGIGSIGSALAWRANALGMRVYGYRRTSAAATEGVERVFTGDELHAMLAECDHVAICLPLTRGTQHLFSTAEFEAMKPSAHIYNIGRGPIIDQDALIQALQSGEIGGAGLDVTDPEPLPADSPLWDMTNVQITCHTSGSTPHNMDRTIEIVARNIRHFINDEPLEFVVDVREGY